MCSETIKTAQKASQKFVDRYKWRCYTIITPQNETQRNGAAQHTGAWRILMQRPSPAEERRGRYLGPHTRTKSKLNYDTSVSVLILNRNGTAVTTL